MKRIPRLAHALTIVALLLAAVPAGAATKEVVLGDNFIDPPFVTVAVGDAVHWSKPTTSQAHNVRQSDLLFRSGTATTNPIDYTRRFSAGTFPYFCEVHLTAMSGKVKVPVKVGAAPTGPNFTVTWANSSTNTGTTFDVQFRIGSGAWRAWKTGTSAFKAVFGRSDSPVHVAGGSRYGFRARSKKSGSVSKWSPVKTFQP